jgi:hypothetical protein
LLQAASRGPHKEIELECAFVKSGGTLLAGPDPTGIGSVVARFGGSQAQFMAMDVRWHEELHQE